MSRCLLSTNVFFGVAFVVAFSEHWRRLFSMLKDSESRGLFLFASIDNNQINKNKPWSSWTRYTQFALSVRWKLSVLVQYLASSSHANTIGLLRTRSSVFSFSEIIVQFFAIWIAEQWTLIVTWWIKNKRNLCCTTKGVYFLQRLKTGFHIVVSVVSVVRKKLTGQIQLYGNLPYNCSIQQKWQIQRVVRDRMNSICPMNFFRTADTTDTTIWKPGLIESEGYLRVALRFISPVSVMFHLFWSRESKRKFKVYNIPGPWHSFKHFGKGWHIRQQYQAATLKEKFIFASPLLPVKVDFHFRVILRAYGRKL